MKYLIELSSLLLFVFMFLTCVTMFFYYISLSLFISISAFIMALFLSILGIKLIKDYKNQN